MLREKGEKKFTKKLATKGKPGRGVADVVVTFWIMNVITSPPYHFTYIIKNFR